MKTWKAESLLLVVTVIWGATFTFTKLGLEDSSVYFYIFIRFMIALTLSMLIWGKYLFRIDKQTLKNGLVLGALFAGGFITQTVGLKYTTVTKSAFITGMAVVLTPFAFKILIKKKIKIWQTLGVIITACGLWLFTNPKLDNINPGDVLTLVSTFFWAFYITYIDIFTRNITKFENTIQLVFMQFIVAAPVALLGHLLLDTGNFRFNITPNLIVSLLYNGIIASIFLTLIHTSVQKYSTPVKAALIFSLEPVFATIVAIFALNEFLGGREMSGAAILLFGVIVSEVGENVYNSVRRMLIK